MQRWSLVCNNDIYFKSISQSLFFGGQFFGTLLAGIVADRFGRKRAFLIVLLPAIGFSLASYFVDNPYAWMTIRFLVGITNMAATTIKAVYVVKYLFIFGSFKKFCYTQLSLISGGPRQSRGLTPWCNGSYNFCRGRSMARIPPGPQFLRDLSLQILWNGSRKKHIYLHL